MKSEENVAYHAKADHCIEQYNLTKDDRIKKFWSDLADEWLALEKPQSEPPAINGKGK